MAAFSYEFGDAASPRGHALVMFHPERGDTGVWVTYVIVPPIVMDFAKYLPPMLASLAPMASMGGNAAVPMPPVPERMDNVAAVRRLALARGDDLLDAGVIDVTAVDRLMMATAEAAQRYYDAYTSHLRTIPEAIPAVEVLPANDEEIARYRSMSEGERLSELSKLVGMLRYAVGGHDDRLAEEAMRQIQALGRLLPPKYRVDELLEAAKWQDPLADQLAQLLLDRSFKIFREEYEELPALEAQIREIRSPDR